MYQSHAGRLLISEDTRTPPLLFKGIGDEGMKGELWCNPKITGFQNNFLSRYNSFNKKGT
jgi:hypothetical protein